MHEPLSVRSAEASLGALSRCKSDVLLREDVIFSPSLSHRQLHGRDRVR